MKVFIFILLVMISTVCAQEFKLTESNEIVCESNFYKHHAKFKIRKNKLSKAYITGLEFGMDSITYYDDFVVEESFGAYGNNVTINRFKSMNPDFYIIVRSDYEAAIYPGYSKGKFEVPLDCYYSDISKWKWFFLIKNI